MWAEASAGAERLLTLDKLQSVMDPSGLTRAGDHMELGGWRQQAPVTLSGFILTIYNMIQL